ncbi:MAG: hypothetical protein K0Q91_1258 [Fibrobacteria bacterium]|nr:hypothetical protein [Fibrobacteria bacterium]
MRHFKQVNRILLAGGILLAAGEAFPQSSWTLRNPPPSIKTLQSITWTGSLLVAVGDSGYTLTSANGSNWTSPVSITGSALYGVASNGTSIVAVGAAGTIRTSADGLTWTTRSSPTTSALHAVTWTGSQYIAVGASATMLSSSDGVTWASVATGVAASIGFNSVKAGGGVIVVAGDNGTLLTSPTGSAWTAQTSGTTQALYSVAWMAGQFVVVGRTGTLLTSTTGAGWTSRTSGVTSHLSSVTSAGSQFVIVGDGGVVLTSSDGTTWAPSVSGVLTGLRSVAWTGATHVAVGVGGAIRTSPDAVAWSGLGVTTRSLNAGAVAGDSVSLVAVGDTGTIVTSSDGVTWTLRASGVTRTLYGVVWADTMFVAVGTSGTILTSKTGATWVAQTSGIASSLNSIAFNGTTMVVVGAGGAILTSANGIVWTPRTSPTTQTLNSVVWSGTQFVAVGAAGTIATSAAGTTWATQNSGVSSTLYSVASAGNQLVAVGAGGVVRISPDGITWSVRTSGVTSNLYSVTWGGALMTATTAGGTILTSLDAVTWAAQSSSSTKTTATLNASAWTKTQVFVFGAGGTIISSPRSLLPVAPALVTPAAGATGVSVFANLSWSAVPGAALYRVQVSTQSNFSSFVLQDSLTGTSKTTAQLGNTTLYYWRVNSSNALGVSDWSQARSFTTGTAPTGPPMPPALLSPIQFATGVPRTATLTWQASDGASSYRVQVATNSGMSPLVVDDSLITATSKVTSLLAGNTAHYWRVAGKNSFGYGGWSEKLNFFTEQGSAIVSRKLAFSKVSGAAGMVRFKLEKSERVTLRVWDTEGRLVADLLNETRAPGSHAVPLPAALKGSLYLLRFSIGSSQETLKIFP